MTHVQVLVTCRGHYNLASPCHPVILVDLSLLVVDTCVVMPCLYSPLFPEFLRHLLGLGSGERIYDASVIRVMCLDEPRDVLHEVFLQGRFFADRIVQIGTIE